MTVLLLLASPLVGPATWAPVAARLRDAGHETVVTDPRTAEAPAAGEPVVLVPHSNAGYWAPGLASRLDAVATVYVDAALPTEVPTTPLAPPALLEHLRTLADDDGRLPPWSRWWDEADLAGLFPDETTRLSVQRAEPRLPLTYFTGRVSVPDDWEHRRSAYLAFGSTYAEEADRAGALGWPVERLDGGHLHLLHDPDAVAASVLRLAAAARA